jgi:hypothetical protein
MAIGIGLPNAVRPSTAPGSWTGRAVCFPASPDPAQVELLAEAVLR